MLPSGIKGLILEVINNVKLACERPKILVIIFLFLRCHSKTFELFEPVYNNACILTSLYQFDKKLTKQVPDNI